MVEVSKDGLLPCPFCGGEAQIRGTTETEIKCTNDQCIIDPRPFNNYGHRDDAIHAWNVRVGTDALAANYATLQAERDRYRVALEDQQSFIQNYLAPWGSWKTVWWESEVSDDAAFSDENALKHLANMAGSALSDTPTVQS